MLYLVVQDLELDKIDNWGYQPGIETHRFTGGTNQVGILSEMVRGGLRLQLTGDLEGHLGRDFRAGGTPVLLGCSHRPGRAFKSYTGDWEQPMKSTTLIQQKLNSRIKVITPNVIHHHKGLHQALTLHSPVPINIFIKRENH